MEGGGVLGLHEGIPGAENRSIVREREKGVGSRSLFFLSYFSPFISSLGFFLLLLSLNCQ